MQVARPSSLSDLDHWSTYVLPPLNSAIQLSPLAAQRLVVHPGIWGSSIGRHYQDLLPGLRHDPSNGLTALTGPGGLSFRAYFDQLATRTGTGHPNGNRSRSRRRTEEAVR